MPLTNLAKRFLARKSVLARILKYVVPEFANSSFADIEKKYIEGEPIFNIDKFPLEDTLDIKGKSTESNSPSEGLVTFDIIFDAISPHIGVPIKLISTLNLKNLPNIFIINLSNALFIMSHV